MLKFYFKLWKNKVKSYQDYDKWCIENDSKILNEILSEIEIS